MTDSFARILIAGIERRVVQLEARVRNVVAGTGVTQAQVNASIAAQVPQLITTALTPSAWTPFAYGAGWADVSTYQPGAWMRDVSGRIFLRGTVRFSPGTLTTTIATLPAQARPAAICQYPCRGGDNSATYVHVRPTGVIEFGGSLAAANASVTLDGISFDLRA